MFNNYFCLLRPSAFTVTLGCVLPGVKRTGPGVVVRFREDFFSGDAQWSPESHHFLRRKPRLALNDIDEYTVRVGELVLPMAATGDQGEPALGFCGGAYGPLAHGRIGFP